jgi:hypothetical protein
MQSTVRVQYVRRSRLSAAGEELDFGCVCDVPQIFRLVDVAFTSRYILEARMLRRRAEVTQTRM